MSLDVRVPALYSGYLMRRLVNAIVCRNARFGDPILYEREVPARGDQSLPARGAERSFWRNLRSTVAAVTPMFFQLPLFQRTVSFLARARVSCRARRTGNI